MNEIINTIAVTLIFIGSILYTIYESYDLIIGINLWRLIPIGMISIGLYILVLNYIWL